MYKIHVAAEPSVEKACGSWTRIPIYTEAALAVRLVRFGLDHFSHNHAKITSWACINSLKYASITHAAITNKIVKNLFNAYSYHVIILKMESSASSSNSADADAAISLEVSKPYQPRAFSFPKRKFGKSKSVLCSFQAGWFQAENFNL